MGTSVFEYPLPKTFPKAGWVNAAGGRKPFTDLKMDVDSMKAEELAAIIGIPNVYRDDSTINLWNYARPLLAEAFAVALDDAVFFGEDAPPSFPVGGVAAAATNVPGGSDHVDTLNDAMSAVEMGGLPVTGFAADIAVRGALRNMRDSDGALICGCEQAGQYERTSLFGLPIAYTQFTQPQPDTFVGDWKYLFIGVRQDIRYEFSTDATIVDNAGNVVLSAFQDNVTVLKAWGRFGCAIVRPVTRRAPDGANAFATTTLSSRTGAGGASAASSRRTTGKAA
jgi:HK97 family phage major capsid protein